MSDNVIPIAPATSMASIPIPPPLDTGPFTSIDRVLLRRAVALLEGAKTDLTSPDAAIAEKARNKVTCAFGYIVGYLDGRGFSLGGAVNQGFQGAFVPVAMDPFEAINELVKQLKSLLADPTRATPVGMAIGSLIYAIGVYVGSQ